MAQHSALLNVMTNAAQKAARHLLRDFGEVENLQVSTKGPGDFVSRADRESERLIKEYLALYETEGIENEQIKLLLDEPDPATDTPAEIKRGAWL